MLFRSHLRSVVYALILTLSSSLLSDNSVKMIVRYICNSPDSIMLLSFCNASLVLNENHMTMLAGEINCSIIASLSSDFSVKLIARSWIVVWPRTGHMIIIIPASSINDKGPFNYIPSTA